MKNSFKKTIRMSNSFDPDLVRHIVGPDLGPNCLQRLLQTTKIVTNMEIVKEGMIWSGTNHMLSSPFQDNK